LGHMRRSGRRATVVPTARPGVERRLYVEVGAN
jgi:hypothetical protein